MLKKCLQAICLSFAIGAVQAAGLDGYDPVSYFAGGAPVKGTGAITAEFHGEQYSFTSTGNRDAFLASPETYLPQYAGNCAYAVSLGKLVPGDPQVFKVVDGKLYLNVTRRAATLWEQDIPGNIRSAETNWPTIRK